MSWSNHGNKHVPSSSLEWKKIVKDTGGGKAAKYKHGINIEALEKQAWEHGIKVSTPAGKNVVYKIFQVDHIIGASDGKETNMMRVECFSRSNTWTSNYSCKFSKITQKVEKCLFRK